MDKAVFTGRQRVPLRLKLNPIWWFRNDYEQQLPDWYEPGLPRDVRQRDWSIRNPLQNFRAVVAGVEDKNYSVVGRAPVLTVQRNDLQPPERGFQWCVLHGGDLWLPRAFLSYSGKHVVWQLGHQPSGFWAFVKFNLHHAQ